MQDSSKPAPLEVGVAVGQIIVLLRKVLGRSHPLRVDVRDTPMLVTLEAEHLTQLLTSIATVTVATMPQPGEVVLTVDRHEIDDDLTALKRGAYVRIQVVGVAAAVIYLPEVAPIEHAG